MNSNKRAVRHIGLFLGMLLSAASGAQAQVQTSGTGTLVLNTGNDFVGLNPEQPTTADATAATRLRQLHSELGSWAASTLVLAQLSATERAQLELAQQTLKAASLAYGSEQPVAQVYDQLGRSLGALLQIATSSTHPQHQTMRGFSERLSNSVRAMTVQLLDAAVRGGAPAADASIWRANLEVADAALRRGEPQVAVLQYSQMGKVISNGLQFDIGAFEQAIRDEMQGEAVGYSYAIVRNGLLHASDGVGSARKPGAPGKAQSEFKPMYIASMSKTISSLAMLRVLQNLGISPDASILGYLPSYWVKHPSIGQITFRHLMSHRSGLDVTAANGAALGLSGGVSGQSVTTLRTLIAAGIQNGNLLEEGEDAPYINANFALLRVLVPRMTFGEPFLTGMMDPAKSNEDAVYSAFFAQLASAYVLQPTGMAPTNCAPRESLQNQTLYYSILNNNVSDLRNHAIGGNHQRVCGATGFYLSAVELAGVLAYQRHSNAIIGNAMRSEMNSSFLGWLNPAAFESTVTGDFGTYRAHGGDSASSGASAGMAGCMMDFPIQVQAVLLINSRGGPGGAASCSLLRNAYDGAWTYP